MSVDQGLGSLMEKIFQSEVPSIQMLPSTEVPRSHGFSPSSKAGCPVTLRGWEVLIHNGFHAEMGHLRQWTSTKWGRDSWRDSQTKSKKPSPRVCLSNTSTHFDLIAMHNQRKQDLYTVHLTGLNYCRLPLTALRSTFPVPTSIDQHCPVAFFQASLVPTHLFAGLLAELCCNWNHLVHHSWCPSLPLLQGTCGCTVLIASCCCGYV